MTPPAPLAPAAGPLVSVAMITYNHRAYIAQALDSVLAQQRDFPIEIVISDDRSPDGTGTVVDEYQARHPELIRRVDPPHNVGMNANFDRVWRACRGKYIALLEGDDWWHDPYKLATQVRFLDSHPYCSISGHVVNIIGVAYDGSCIHPKSPDEIPAITDHSLLFQYNYLQTCSVMLRRGVVAEVPTWFSSFKLIDWPLFVLHALHGKVGFLANNMASYRVHAGGVWSSRPVDERLAEVSRMWEVFAQNVPHRECRAIASILSEVQYKKYISYLSSGWLWLARHAFATYLIHRWRAGKLPISIIPWMIVRLALPRLWSPTGRPPGKR